MIRKQVLYLILLVLLLCQPVILHAAPQPPAVEAYWQQLEQLRARVLELQALSAVEAQPVAQELSQYWQALTAVRLDDGTLLPLDHGWLTAALRAEPPEFARLERTLVAQLEVHHRNPDPLWPAEARTTLTHILTRPEFHTDSRSNPLTEWWNKLWEWLFDWLDEILPGDQTIVVGSNWVPYIITIAGSVILMLTLWRVLQEMVGMLVAESDLSEEAEATIPLTGATALKRAQTLSAAGNYRSAIRYLYLSTLLQLEERSILHGDRTLTNREYLRQLQQRPQLAQTFRDIVDVFERVWYGQQSIDDADYAEYAAQVKTLEEES